MYFVKTSSEHIDPILSLTPQTIEENNVSTNCENTDDDSDLEITGFMQKNGASASYDIETTGFIPSTAPSANTNNKKAGYILIKKEDDGGNCSKD